ncbi:TetR/AcrR family transcriptional regulator [Deinococcus aquatilis]|uniref:TetR/AcrR family transcriptional regulator n=1 Tax=Deinococcus aquatilis TaxID=519440 RepID=UPI00036AD7CA|nr:TetR/AcrR family transcriptional regulator [Deinococcus aquatilis]
MARLEAPNLSSELIVNTALQQMRDHHLEDISMRPLAEALRVTPRALYRYFPTKEDLLRAAYIQVMGGFELPTTGKWQDRLRRFALDFRNFTRDHSHIGAYLFSPHQPTHAEFRLLEFIVTTVRDAGVADHEIWVTSRNTLLNVYSMLRDERNTGAPEPDYAELLAFMEERPGHYPAITELAQQRVMASATRYHNQIELLIGGIQARAASQACA